MLGLKSVSDMHVSGWKADAKPFVCRRRLVEAGGGIPDGDRSVELGISQGTAEVRGGLHAGRRGDRRGLRRRHLHAG
jgi:hypothetical protein